MSDYFKDVLALVVGTVLVMMVWFALGGGMHRLSPDREMDSRSGGSAVVATSLILAGTATAQTPGAGPGGMGPGATPAPGGPTTPGTPGTTTPRMPGSTTPGVPGTTTPGMSDPTPGAQCPPGQARRPGSSICMPATPGAPIPPPTR